jgi:peroxisomal membrane protein 4
MILLYKRDKSLKSNAKFVFNAAKEHATNLGTFVFLFKMLRCQLMNRAGIPSGKASLVAGGLVGSLVWGRERSAINYQVVLYLLSRILTGLIHHQVKKGALPDVPAFSALAGFVWGVVMYLFTVDPDSLHGSLRSSMEFLYNDERTSWTESFLGIPGSVLPFIPFSGV